MYLEKSGESAGEKGHEILKGTPRTMTDLFSRGMTWPEPSLQVVSQWRGGLLEIGQKGAR